jgi:hypothetical protein
VVNPVTGRCVGKDSKTGKTLLNSNPPKGTNANSADALIVVTNRLLERLKTRTWDLKPPKSMLLSMSQVKRIKKKHIVLSVVPPQLYGQRVLTETLTAYSKDIVEDLFYEGLIDGVAVTGGGHVWWVVSPQLVAWLEKKL